jgi:hypothetical protein
MLRGLCLRLGVSGSPCIHVVDIKIPPTLRMIVFLYPDEIMFLSEKPIESKGRISVVLSSDPLHS